MSQSCGVIRSHEYGLSVFVNRNLYEIVVDDAAYHARRASSPLHLDKLMVWRVPTEVSVAVISYKCEPDRIIQLRTRTGRPAILPSALLSCFQECSRKHPSARQTN